MGWIAIFKDGRILREDDPSGRPVHEGNNGELALVAQEDFGNKVAIDLVNGVVIIGYDQLGWQNGTVEIHGPKLHFWICDETNVVGGMVNVTPKTEPDENGWYENEVSRYIWRPIWFTRYTNNDPTKVIGAQTTLTENDGGKNVKKLVNLFSDGRIGID